MVGPKITPTLPVPRNWIENKPTRIPMVINITVSWEIPVWNWIPSVADMTLMEGVRMPSAIVREAHVITMPIITLRAHLLFSRKSFVLEGIFSSWVSTPKSDGLDVIARRIMEYKANTPPSP
ncbi:hypothetical protein FR483_n112L [Paramecium bursaria Chlorella virus FR483]|uniref:Uncharacterized protein n112L n=1 Tax=Paramecium bursaria Chlorella virus FR483 TaxID=399781 RepID=A7J6G6_PBCVF|nr:hypothetical protein FR483_n112L [Paramecium bursaria Chlorella virus FR483]ABT15397.1 hypothetical protein FR483_n112L [Paramecium bursaria Chlorella virus FR483]